MSSNYPAKATAIKLDNTFWTSNNSRLLNTVIGFRLRNEIDHPFVNFEYPYQLVINFYSAGPSYFADMTQLMGGVNIDGSIDYQYGWKGKMLSSDSILWLNDGSVWTRVTPPINRYNNKYDASSIYNKDVSMTSYLSDKMESAYPLQPGLPHM
jgi:hypothetical protein